MNAPSTSPETQLSELLRVLWQQRRQLERLQYLLHVQGLILASGDDSMLRHAVDDIQKTTTAISEIELDRSELTTLLGTTMGIGSQVSLEQLVEAAPEPYDEILAEHRDAFLTLVADITTTSHSGRDQLRRGLRLTQELTSFVVGDAGDGGYDRTGTGVRGSAEHALVDWSL